MLRRNQIIYFAVNDLERNAYKCKMQEKEEKVKCIKAIQEGNRDGAQIHVESSMSAKADT